MVAHGELRVRSGQFSMTQNVKTVHNIDYLVLSQKIARTLLVIVAKSL